MKHYKNYPNLKERRKKMRDKFASIPALRRWFDKSFDDTQEPLTNRSGTNYIGRRACRGAGPSAVVRQAHQPLRDQLYRSPSLSKGRSFGGGSTSPSMTLWNRPSTNSGTTHQPLRDRPFDKLRNRPPVAEPVEASNLDIMSLSNDRNVVI